VRGPGLARAQEDGCSIGCSDEPEQRVDKIDPDGALHADDTALLGRRIGVDEDLAKDAEECEPENAMVTVSVDCLVTRWALQQLCAAGAKERWTYVRIQSQAKAQYDLKNGMP